MLINSLKCLILSSAQTASLRCVVTCRSSRFLLALLVLLLTSCQQSVLIEDLSSSESVEVLVLLNRSGIPASRNRVLVGKEIGYEVSVLSENYYQALELIHSYGFPRAHASSIQDLTKRQGFAPQSQKLTQFRLDHALGLEVERLLEAFDGVVEARAVIRAGLNCSSGMGREVQLSSASIVIKHLSQIDGVFPIDRAVMADIVSRAVPGLTTDKIDFEFVALKLPVEVQSVLVTVEPFSFQIPKRQKRLALTQLFVVMALCFIGGMSITASGYLIARKRARSRKVE